MINQRTRQNISSQPSIDILIRRRPYPQYAAGREQRRRTSLASHHLACRKSAQTATASQIATTSPATARQARPTSTTASQARSTSVTTRSLLWRIKALEAENKKLKKQLQAQATLAVGPTTTSARQPSPDYQSVVRR